MSGQIGPRHLSAARLHRTLVSVRVSWLPRLLLMFVSAVGCADDSSQQVHFGQPTASPNPTPTGGAPAPTNSPIEGFWAIYANVMDGTVVDLHADGSQITGRGCLSGWLEPYESDSRNQCGEITGTIEGNQISFQFDFVSPFPGTYGVDAELLESGARMNGRYWFYDPPYMEATASVPESKRTARPATVFRPPQRDPNEFSWPWSRSVPMEVNSALALAPYVALLGNAAAGKFTPGTRYKLETLWGGLIGDLGVFAPVDLSTERPEAGVVVVHAGPVDQVQPDNPIALTIEVRDEQVVSVEAALASGEKLSFAP